MENLKWVEKIDDVDDVFAKDINLIAHYAQELNKNKADSDFAFDYYYTFDSMVENYNEYTEPGIYKIKHVLGMHSKVVLMLVRRFSANGVFQLKFSPNQITSRTGNVGEDGKITWEEWGKFATESYVNEKLGYIETALEEKGNKTEEPYFIKLSDCIRLNLYDETTIDDKGSLDPLTGKTDTSMPNYMNTDFIGVKPFEKYCISYIQSYEVPEGSNTTCRVMFFGTDKSAVIGERTIRRYRTGRFYHPIEIPENAYYMKVSFRDTDKHIEIYNTQKSIINKSQELFYNDNSFTQGMCVSDKYAFISRSPSKNGNPDDYVIRKVDLATGDILATGTQSYRHANGMTYNNRTNKILVCSLEGTVTSTTTVSDLDYSLYVVNPDTFAIEDTINLKSIVQSVCSDSVGISGVAYNSKYDEYYVLSRYPTRYIITLDSSFELKNYFYMFEYSDDEGTRGDICTDGQYIYSTNWRSDMKGLAQHNAQGNSLVNEIHVFARNGEFVGVFSVDGCTHIESMDIKGGSYYFNFIDFSDNRAKTFKTNDIFNLTI